MMRQIKMIGLDLDGTLLNTQKELTDYTKSVLEKAIEKGVTVLAATGRPATGIPQELLDLPGIRYAVTANGARILDLEQNKVIYECLIAYDISREILNIFEKYDTLREICIDGRSFMEERQVPDIARYVSGPMERYLRRTRVQIPSLQEKMEEMRGHSLDKIQGVFADPQEMLRAKKQIARLGSLNISGAMGNNLEINALGADKGSGLCKLGELLGIRPEEIMACGDGNNDLDMIRMAGIGVAMDNAVQEAIEAADYITLSNDEDGAAKAIERFVL